MVLIELGQQLYTMLMLSKRGPTSTALINQLFNVVMSVNDGSQQNQRSFSGTVDSSCSLNGSNFD